MCIPSKSEPQTFVFQGGDATFALLNQDSHMSSSLFDDNQATRNEAFHSLPTQDNMKHCVQHNYHDHANDDDAIYLEAPIVTKGGVPVIFPIKLHNMLDHIDLFEPELSSIVRWQPHGRCFLVKKPKDFTESVLPRFFDQRKYASFQRQLNLYGFNRITTGPDKGSYYHELFLRSKKVLCRGIHRMKIKGTGTRMASNPDQEPNFYVMEQMPPSSTGADTSAKKNVQPETIRSNDRSYRVTPPTPIKSESDCNVAKMPSLQLPIGVSVNSINTLGPLSLIEDNKFSSSTQDDLNSLNCSIQSHQITSMPTTLVKREDPSDDASSTSSDLSFVFGDMPFHSVDTSKPYAVRRNSFLTPLSSNESSSNSSRTSTTDVIDSFDTDMCNIVGNKIDLCDQEMSDLLEKIVNEEVRWF